MKNWIISFLIFGVSSFGLSGQSDVTVYLFLLDDCVICQSYTPKLRQLHQEYGSEIPFIGIFPNFSSKPEGIEVFTEKYEIPFETRTDYWKDLTRKFQVEVTPEVVVYHHSSETIIYKGRIDNEFFSLGKRRRVVTTDELREVLSAVKSGNLNPFPFTEAIGCFINFNDPTK